MLHRGHRLLLSFAASKSEKVLVGVTSDEYLEKFRKPHPVEPYELRALTIFLFLKQQDPSLSVSIVPINDEYGPAISDAESDCIFVSEETLPGALKINLLRRLKGLTPLKVYSIEVLSYGGTKLSSTLLWRETLSSRSRSNFLT